ncbi:MAG: hypothetical protein JNK12_14075 [Acidimicrobiales bacterium]|nr:hypothetical protein [Acidimicrobiales bacterium]
MTITETLTNMPAAGILASLDLDLSMVRMKLATPEEGEPWEQAKLDVAEAEYRKFLALNLAYPDEAIVPCRLVDQLWHQHILDTAAYRDDCERLFGFFFDHYPYFGLNGPEDAANLQRAYNVTVELYELNFGPPPVGAWGKGTTAAKCRTGCKPVKCKSGTV